MRRRYETAVNREMEQKVALYISKKKGHAMSKLTQTVNAESWEPADFIELAESDTGDRLVRIAIWEIKCRDYIWNFFERYGYMISEKKMQHAFQLAIAYANRHPILGSPEKVKALPVRLCVRTIDPQLWVCELASKDDLRGIPMAMGGRKDRNDPKDIEPCYFIPASRFRRFA